MTVPLGKVGLSRDSEQSCRWSRRLTLFALLLITFIYFFPRWADWYANSRFDLVQAAVDRHTLIIDQYVANTGDYAYYHGHYYSDKAPGMFFLGVPVYAAFRAIVPPSALRFLDRSAQDDRALGETLRQGGSGITDDKMYVFVALT